MDKLLLNRLKISLFVTRMGIFLVFLMWALDKVVNPGHGLRVFEMFYGLNVTSQMMVTLGYLQLVFVLVFGLGLWKKWVYLAILVLHSGSTLSSFSLYLDPFNNLLFFAAWPMLAACLFLYLLKDYDTWDIYQLKNKNA
jgi:putative oxidoreductase